MSDNKRLFWTITGSILAAGVILGVAQRVLR